MGYVAYTVWTRVSDGGPPKETPSLLLALGTQFPDLVDKPLHLWFGIYQGRAIAHSLVVLVPLCLVVIVAAHRFGRTETGIAFSLGTLVHLPGDAWPAVVHGSVLDRAGYLFWPLLPLPTYETDSVGDHFERVVADLNELQATFPAGLLESFVTVQLLIAAAVTVLWAYDGFPGPGLLWRTVAGLK